MKNEKLVKIDAIKGELAVGIDDILSEIAESTDINFMVFVYDGQPKDAGVVFGSFEMEHLADLRDLLETMQHCEEGAQDMEVEEGSRHDH